MKILITTVQVPFVAGGAEIHAQGLLNALRKAGHEAEIVAVPFKWYPAETIIDQMLACRLLDISESCGQKIDRVIALKFPAYFMQHPNKFVWLLHQHRPAYELWNHSHGDLHHSQNGQQTRNAIHRADRALLSEATAVFANSGNVAGRLRKFSGIDAEPLYHPPQGAEEFYCDEAEDYFFFPSRLTPLKRQSLVVEALGQTEEPVRVRFAGRADDPSVEKKLRHQASALGVAERVEWLASVDEEEKRKLYARSIAVIYPPLDEDYGYVTLEAMLSGKPVITCEDSGGPLEFVRDEANGLIAAPTAESLARCLDRLWRERREAKEWGAAGRKLYDSMDISWSRVVERLAA